MNSAVVGINWGDEGKGRMVDYFAERYDVVVRFQGGGNAGHTVINEKYRKSHYNNMFNNYYIINYTVINKK